MADNVAITAGSGTTVATDDVSGIHYQKVKLFSSVADSAEGIGDTDKGTDHALWVDPRPLVTRIAVTPTISSSPAYTAKDAIGGLMTFSNAVRASGGTCMIQALQVVDKDNTPQDAIIDLVLFDRSITAPTDNAIFAPSDAEAANCVGVIPVTIWSDFSVNSVAFVNNVGLEVVLNGTDLFAVAVARSTPTYSGTTDLVFTLTIVQD